MMKAKIMFENEVSEQFPRPVTIKEAMQICAKFPIYRFVKL